MIAKCTSVCGFPAYISRIHDVPSRTTNGNERRRQAHGKLVKQARSAVWLGKRQHHAGALC